LSELNVITGASGAIPRNNIREMEAHARLYYTEIRKRKSDIEAISRNTGFSANDIEKVKQHIFYNKYDLGEEEPTCFDPDYDMAVSWQRLINGVNIREMDIVMLNHELTEHELMTRSGLSYSEAHVIADKKYSYSKYIHELNQREGI
jgi:hypothetical protein